MQGLRARQEHEIRVLLPALLIIAPNTRKMIGKKKDPRLVDLECMIPKEHKLEAGIEPQPTPASEQPEPEPGPERFREVCHVCSRTSEEAVLIPVFHQGEDRWMCPSCLKSRMDSGTQAYYGTGETSAESPSTDSSPDYGGAMSMFD